MLPYSEFAFMEWTFDKSSLQRTKNEQYIIWEVDIEK